MPQPSRQAVPAEFNPNLYAAGEAAVAAEPTPDQRTAVDGLAAAAAAARTERIAETFGSLAATPEGQRLVVSYEAVHRHATEMFGLVGEAPPPLESPQLVEQLTGLLDTFRRLEALNLDPHLVVAPEHRSLAWWETFAVNLQNSALNPTEPDPENAGQTRGVLRQGGLWVADDVKAGWQEITNPGNEAPTWALDVISGTDRPQITSVTSYGYTDDKNQAPSPELNKLLKELGYSEVVERKSRRNKDLPLVQPDIHPVAETYLTHQFNRLTTGQQPIDANTYSWLKGELPSGSLPVGSWHSIYGRVRLDWGSAGSRDDYIGARASGRGRT
jgi:hypothetical protein